MKVQDKILFFISLLVVVFETYHQFHYVSMFFRGYFYTSLWFICCFSLRTSIINLKVFFPFLLFFFFAFLYYLRGGEYYNLCSFTQLLLMFTYYIVPPLLFLHYRKFISTNLSVFCLVILLILTSYSLIVTIPFASEDASLIRLMAVDHDLGEKMSILGVMSYSLSHGVVFIIPGLCYIIKASHKIKYKIIAVAITIEVFFVIYYSGASTPLILGISIFLISLVYSSKRSLKHNLVVIFFISCFTLLALNDSVLYSIIDASLPVVEGTPFE